MALDRENQLIDVTGSYVHELFEEQSWYRENANTVTVVGGFLSTVAASLASQPISDNPYVAIAILVLGFAATILGVKRTHNGFSASQVKKIDDARAQVIDNATKDIPAVEQRYEVGEQLALPFPPMGK